MRGRPKTVEEILPEVWRIVGELQRLTEGLEEAVAAARKDSDGPDD